MTGNEADGLLTSLAELRRAQPSLRFGQLIASLALVARGDSAGAVWEVEDDELAGAIRWQLDRLREPVADSSEATAPTPHPTRQFVLPEA